MNHKELLQKHKIDVQKENPKSNEVDKLEQFILEALQQASEEDAEDPKPDFIEHKYIYHITRGGPPQQGIAFKTENIGKEDGDIDNGDTKVDESMEDVD